MKKISLLFILFLVSSISNAQQEISTAYATQANNMFAPLDKTRITHKILLDFGFEFTNVKAYNGTLTDSTVVDATKLKHIYNTIFSSRVTSSTTGFINPNNYESDWKTNRAVGTIALSGLYYKYNAFINNAINLGKVNYINNQFQDKFVGGVWQNPYQEFQAFAMAPAITKYEGLSLQVKIPSTIFYSNYQSLVQSIQIDFGNGAGYVNVAFNQNITVNYTVEGVKVWKYKLNLTNGTSLLSQSKIEITQGVSTIPWGSNSPQAMANQSITSSTIYSQSITATKAFNGSYGTVKLTIDDTNNDGIRKPLIVAEGFDGGIILAPELANGMNTYTTFRTSAFFGDVELRNLIYNSNKQYDIIYVDWDNGVDYLQKNAFALEEVIKWVNTQKGLVGSTQKNVVLGQSMGGVVARYALADMEQTGLIHDTRLFVSHDAPQQGANIPVSLQYMFRHLTNLYIQFSTPYNIQVVTVPFLETSILDQPATKQMLMNWSSSNYSITNTISSSFYSELRGKGLANSGGYPINCRNIAISNGAECGITQGFNAGDDLLSYNLGGGLPLWANLLTPVLASLGWTTSGNLGLLGVELVSNLPGSSRYDVYFNAKSIPYGAGNEIYNGRIYYTKTIFKIFGWSPKITVDITNVKKNQPTGVLPIDHYAGGRYDTTLFTAGASLPSGVYIRDKFNFIPTPSALDIGKGIVSLNDNDYKMAYVGATPPIAPKNTPFANFSTDFDKFNPNLSNSTHISFNSRNGQWLARELNTLPITTNCSYMCTSSQINGANTICTSASYSAPSGGTFYNWSITQGAELVTFTGNGTQNIALTALPNASGEVIISLTMGDNGVRCGNITITKSIWIGIPQFKEFYFYGGTFTTLCIAPIDYLTTDLPSRKVKAIFDGMSSSEILDNLNWEWEAENYLIMLNGTKDTRTICPMETGFSSFKVRAQNACGWSEWYQIPQFEITLPPNNFRQSSIYAVYPNPSEDIVNIDLRDQKNQPDQNTTISGELFDMIGQSKSKVKINNNKAIFSVKGLNKGIYVLKIYMNDEVESHQIAVE